MDMTDLQIILLAVVIVAAVMLVMDMP